MSLLKRLIANDDGQDIVEYALLVGFLALVCVLAITNLGITLNTTLGNANTQLRADGGV